MLKKFVSAGFGGAGSQVINLFSLLIIARLYDPEAFAALAVVMAIASIIGWISCFRYELAVVIPKDKKQAASLFWLCIYSSASMAIISGLLLFCCWQLGMFRSGGIISLSCYTIFTPLMVFAMGCTLTMRYWHIRLGNFALNSTAMLALALVTGLMQIFWAIAFQGNYIGLLIGRLAGQVIMALVLVFGLKSNNFPSWKYASPRLMFDAAIQYKRFFQYSTPGTFFGVIRSQAPVLILEAFLSSREVGAYSLAYRVLYFPLSLVSGALRPVIFQAAATNGVNAVEYQINRILGILALMVTPVIVFYFFYADELFAVVLGSKWLGTGDIGKFIIIPVFVFLFCGWMDRILDLLNFQRLMMVMEMFFGGASIAGLWIGLELGFGIHGALFLQSIILTSYGITYLNLAYDRANYNRDFLIKVVWRVFFAASAAWVLLTVIKNIV